MGKREVVDKTWKQISNKSQKNSHFRAERGNERFVLRFVWDLFSSLTEYLFFFHCVVPAILLFPMPQVHASSPAHPQAHASSPCQAPASSPCLKPIPLFPTHLSPPCLKSSPPYFPFFALILRYLSHLISLY